MCLDLATFRRMRYAVTLLVLAVALSGTFTVASVAGGSYGVTAAGSAVPPSITLNPSSAQVGATVQVSGSGFSTSDTSCYLSSSAASTSTCSISDGTFSASFVVANVAASTYTVTITGLPDYDSASATFAVGERGSQTTIMLNPTSGAVGSTVQVYASGFSTSDTSCSLSGTIVAYSPYFATSACSISNGVLTATFTVAAISSGTYTVAATGHPEGDSVSATFTLTSSTPAITLNPAYASVGSTVEVVGSGFSLGDSTCSISGSSIESGTCTIIDGSVTASFTVANVSVGAIETIRVTGSPVGDSSSTLFEPGSGSMMLNPTSGAVGSTVQVYASGFSTRDTSCYLSGTAIASQTCSVGDGILTGAFVVADLAEGSYSITAYGKTATGETIPGDWFSYPDFAVSAVSAGAVSLTFNPSSAGVGGTVEFSGSGLSGTACSLWATVIAFQTCSISRTGTYTGAFVVASGAASGSYTVTVVGSPNGNFASTGFTVMGSTTVTSATTASTFFNSTSASSTTLPTSSYSTVYTSTSASTVSSAQPITTTSTVSSTTTSLTSSVTTPAGSGMHVTLQLNNGRER